MSDKKIRGVSPEEELVKRGLLTPARNPGKGLAVNLDEKIFRKGNQTKGKEGRLTECRVPTCTAAQSRRGLCNTHRVYASRLIKQGSANEQNLINRGLLLAKGNPTAANRRLPVRRSKINTRATRCCYPDCKERGIKRGLCRKHHTQYIRKRNKLAAAQRETLDKDLIRRKLLLPEPKAEKVDPFQLGSKVRGNLSKY